jgi:monoamine oxidase
MEVTTDYQDKAQVSHVISTIPLPVLRTIDLTEAGLNPMQSNALRQLNYGPSVKLGMQFKTAWWTLADNSKGERLNIIGGQTYTDSHLRTVVYPSFGDAEARKTTTLIASYC